MTDSIKLSVVTAVYNREATLGCAIDSVAGQTYHNLEYIVIDGMSNDQTPCIIQKYQHNITTAIREPDSGLYDALNKGIQHATGHVVGFLHADDMFYAPTVLASVARALQDPAVDAVYGDLVYVSAQDPQRIIRYWKAGKYDRARFRTGWMPPHPAVYIKTDVYRRLGGYRTDWGSAADYECMLRLMYKQQINVRYVPEIFTRMRVGGSSNASLTNRLKANHSDRQAWIANGLQPPAALRLTKPLRKLMQYWRRPAR